MIAGFLVHQSTGVEAAREASIRGAQKGQAGVPKAHRDSLHFGDSKSESL
jgi:hypothetical protein